MQETELILDFSSWKKFLTEVKQNNPFKHYLDPTKYRSHDG